MKHDSSRSTAMVEEEFDEDEAADLVIRLRKDVAASAKLISRRQARYLVDIYYQIQRQRITAQGQVRSLLAGEEPEPVETLAFIGGQTRTVEHQIMRALDLWTRDYPLSQWARSIVGIGPVIAAGFRAHLDEDPPPTVGHWWRFAGLDPTVTWEKGQVRPWNARLKTLCWKASTSFVKFQNHQNDVYGKLYLTRREYEAAKNSGGDYADQAAKGLKRVGKTTEAYKSYVDGKLSPGHLHSRALRYTVKLFLAHYHAVAFELRYGQPAPLPYPVAVLNHAHTIAIPNWPLKPTP
jgi:hypothetical protein